LKRRIFLSNALLLGLSACSLGRSAGVELAHYDLGIEPTSGIRARLSHSVALDEISAGAWLQSQAILYRLAYSNSARLHAYSRSRWTASPAALLTHRLRLALSASAERGFTSAQDGVSSEHLLKAELDSFEQLVHTPKSSSALVRLRASLIDAPSRRLRAQRSFSVDAPCPSVDAQGAVHALREATDSLIVELIEWLAAAKRTESASERG